MSIRDFLSTWIIVLFFLLSVFQFICINRFKHEIVDLYSHKTVWETYVWNDFVLSSKENEIELHESLEEQLEDSKIVIYVPGGLCRACFSSLLFSLQDNNVAENDIYVVSGINDPEIRAEVMARGLSYSVATDSYENVRDILVFRLYRGYLPIMMRYELGRESVLKLFLLDDENLIYSK